MDFISSISNWCTSPGMWHGGSHGMSGWMPFHSGGIIQLIIIGLIIYFTTRMFHRQSATHNTPSPGDILNKRYASGEIDEKTYLSMLEKLK